MNLQEIYANVNSNEYDFLREHDNLGRNIILLGLGGSHAYGLNKEGSDLDIRGIAANPKSDILLGKDFEQFINTDTDTTIYSFHKLIDLLTKNNPNTIEILGLKPEHYLHVTDIGNELLKNKHLFLSKICIHSFAGYAASQLRRLENKTARDMPFSKKEQHILKTIENARYAIDNKYTKINDGKIELYIDKTRELPEILVDAHLTGYPLRDYEEMLSEMKSIIRSYEKNSKRNEKAESHDKLGKHMAHLLRLYMMCIDILEKEDIITFRKKEHNLLMDIRNGKYLDNQKQPTSDFFDILNQYEKRFHYAKKNTSLPDTPNYKEINDFEMAINERIVKGVAPKPIKDYKDFYFPTLDDFEK